MARLLVEVYQVEETKIEVGMMEKGGKTGFKNYGEWGCIGADSLELQKNHHR